MRQGTAFGLAGRLIDDAPPDLDIVRGLNQTFDLVLLTGVWMHLDLAQRRRVRMWRACWRPAASWPCVCATGRCRGTAHVRRLDRGDRRPGRGKRAEGPSIAAAPGLFGVPGVHWSAVAFRRD